MFLLELFISSVLSFEKIVNEKKKQSNEKCGIISREFYKGAMRSYGNETQQKSETDDNTGTFMAGIAFGVHGVRRKHGGFAGYFFVEVR